MIMNSRKDVFGGPLSASEENSPKSVGKLVSSFSTLSNCVRGFFALTTIQLNLLSGGKRTFQHVSRVKYRLSQTLLITCLLLAVNVALPSTVFAVEADSITQFGITWTFDRDYTVGQFANGDYWVVGPVTIIGIDPPSTEINGRTKNGSMLNIITSHHTYSAGKQGFDSVLNYYDAVN